MDFSDLLNTAAQGATSALANAVAPNKLTAPVTPAPAVPKPNYTPLILVAVGLVLALVFVFRR
jgi:hypothetical protein